MTIRSGHQSTAHMTENIQDPLPLRIACLVHDHFKALPTKSKPHVLADGSKEWIPMTGIVAVKGENTSSESLHCIAVTSGAKCLSASRIPHCRGLVLHDCHAEILAIRAFNHWLMTECHALVTQQSAVREGSITDDTALPESKFIRKKFSGANGNRDDLTEYPPFELQPDVRIYMYCTCAPCGDGSMELCMAAQEDATPWEVQRQSDTEVGSAVDEPKLLDGRAHFSLLGIVRRKPARTDAESTRSKSCSDKLALKQVSSLLTWQTSRLVALTENAYLAALILPEDEISRVACDRAFGRNGRMAALVGQSWPSSSCGGNSVEYQFRPFEVLSVPSEKIKAIWQFAKPKPTHTAGEDDKAKGEATARKSKPGNVSAVWTLAPSLELMDSLLLDLGCKSLPSLCQSKTGLFESLINGVKQGNKASSPSARGASALSRAKMWSLFSKTNAITNEAREQQTLISSSGTSASPLRQLGEPIIYDDVKGIGKDETGPFSARVRAIRHAKEDLRGWIPNTGDENWGLDVLVDTQKRKRGLA